jgi:flagellar biosynthesis chaperone FliJ
MIDLEKNAVYYYCIIIHMRDNKINEELMRNLFSDDVETYKEVSDALKSEYVEILSMLREIENKRIDYVRLCIHKLVSNLSYYAKHSEMMFICRLILFIDKRDSDIEKYKLYIEQLQQYDVEDYL